MSEITTEYGKNLLERVAAGLRNIKTRPEGLLFCDNETEFIWDKKTIAGVPVFHSALVNDAMTHEGVPFIPLWNYESEQHAIERKKFNEGYLNYAQRRS